MAARFLTSNPALAPLFAAVGAGMVGASWFGFHVLKNNQEVLIARGTNPTPWNNVRQDQNTKASAPSVPPPLTPTTPRIPHDPQFSNPRARFGSDNNLYSPNTEFWKSRQGMADPRSSFTDKMASNKVHEVKERALGRS